MQAKSQSFLKPLSIQDNQNISINLIAPHISSQNQNRFIAKKNLILRKNALNYKNELLKRNQFFKISEIPRFK